MNPYKNQTGIFKLKTYTSFIDILAEITTT